MASYLVSRLIQFALVLFFLSIIVFTIVRLIPGDPAAVMLGTEATPQALAQIRQEMGLDQPIPVQYAKWIENVLAGNFGTSWVSKKPALTLILGALPVTLQLVAASFVFGCFHPLSATYAVLAALIGLYLGLLLIFTGNLLAPALAHGLYDFIALVCLVRDGE